MRVRKKKKRERVENGINWHNGEINIIPYCWKIWITIEMFRFFYGNFTTFILLYSSWIVWKVYCWLSRTNCLEYGDRVFFVILVLYIEDAMAWWSDNGVVEWQWCGEVKMVWWSGNDVVKWHWCGEVKMVWWSNNGMMKWQWASWVVSSWTVHCDWTMDDPLLLLYWVLKARCLLQCRCRVLLHLLSFNWCSSEHGFYPS